MLIYSNENYQHIMQAAEGLVRIGVRYPHYVFSRAFSSLSDFNLGCRHFLANEGVLLAMKGQFPQAEIDALPTDIRVLESIPLTVPFLDEARHLLVLGNA